MGKAQFIDVTGDHAFVVVPITLHIKDGGKDGQIMATGTFTLQKGANGWRITGWSWSPKNRWTNSNGSK
jgi:hypothetical protein